MARLSVRINLDPAGRIGPGKIDLLEEIGRSGSISAAGRSMAMSYRRAWDLVEEMNRLFGTPVVESQIGGKNGGGARLTPLGTSLINVYRAAETAAETAAREHLVKLQRLVSEAEAGARPDQTGLRSTSPLAR